MPEILDADPRYATPKLVIPSARGFIHLAADVDAPRRSGPIFARGRAHAELLATLKELAAALEREDGVVRATVFDAVLLPPPGYFQGHWGMATRPPHFDVVVLVETRTPQVARELQHRDAYRRVVETLERRAKRTHVFVARNAKRIADVEARANGLFAFHYYVAEDAGVMLRLWDQLIGWYEVETALDNGALLVPMEGEGSDYVAIDHVRWDTSILKLLWRQLTKESLWKVIRPSLESNRVGAMPILYRLA